MPPGRVLCFALLTGTALLFAACPSGDDDMPSPSPTPMPGDRELLCDDGLDDDGDGNVDCDDDDCADDPACDTPQTELDCADGRDDDGDGQIDCDDADCADGSICTAASCADIYLGSAVGDAVLTDTTEGRSDASSGSCGGDGGFDLRVAWVAPSSGLFDIRLASGMTWDALMYVRDGACDGPELACNNDFGGIEPKVTVYVEEGQVYIIVIDGWSVLHQGAFRLQIEASSLACPDGDLGSATGPSTASDTTAGAGDDFAGTCGGGGGPDRAYIFTPASDGLYTIDLYGSSFDTVLYLLDGSCAGPELGCNNDTLVLQSELAVDLTAGRPVTIIVDGIGSSSSGDFELNITPP